MTDIHPTRLVLIKPVAAWVNAVEQPLDTLDRVINNPMHMNAVQTALDNASAEPDLREVADGMRAWIADVQGNRFGPQHSDEVQAAAYVLFSQESLRDMAFRWATATPKHDLKRALRLSLLAATAFRKRYVDSTLQLLRGTPTDPAPFMLTYVIDRLVEIAPEYTIEERKDAVAGLNERGIDVEQLHPMARVQLAQIAGDQAAVDAMARVAAEDPSIRVKLTEMLNGPRKLLAATRDPEAFEKLAAAASPYVLCFGGGPTFAKAMQHLPVETIARSLIHAIGTCDDPAFNVGKGDRKVMLQLAACIDDARIAKLIAQRAHEKNITVLATEYFERFVHRIDALEDIAATKVSEGAKTKSSKQQREVAAMILEVVRRRVAASVAASATTRTTSKKRQSAKQGHKLSRFADPHALPAPIVAATNAPLSPDEVEDLLALLASLPNSPDTSEDPRVREIRQTYTPDSLDVFVWTLLSDWSLAGAQAKSDWALYASGHLGSDALARKLDARCADWVKGGKVAVMQKALDVLAMMGRDPAKPLALSLLYERGLRARFEDTQQRVRDLLEAIAVRRAITYEELEDQLVPDLGLGDGPILLDYGSRTLEVKLDERLVPILLDGSERSATPPRATKKMKDDPAKAKAARERFDTLKEDLEQVATTQILRFERAMREARTWNVDAWRREVVRHPLLRHLATKLVWGITSPLDEQSTEGLLVRVAEDGTFADCNDNPIEPPGTAVVLLAHPVDVPEKESWTKMERIFLDYELLQPFPQLVREVIDVPPSIEKVALCMEYANTPVLWSSVMALLTGRGWRRTSPTSGTVRFLELPLDRLGAKGAVATLEISPGLTIGPVKARPAQTVFGLKLEGGGITFGDLSRRAASELLRDVATLI